MLLVVSVSWGNDSVALVQWLHERFASGVYDQRKYEVVCVYSDTGWASHEWPARVTRGEDLARSYGFDVVHLQTEGFVQLARRKKGFPRQGMQFCTQELKMKPILAFLDRVDPDRDAIVAVGIRRAESKARSQWPEEVPNSPNHGGRDAWFPLVRVSHAERDALLARARFESLPYRSKECSPCINSNRADLRLLTEARIAEIEAIEAAMGHTGEGKPRTLFRPYRHGGAVGIREVVRWAWSERGQYDPDDGCDSGYCGD